jgi:Transposase IS116/IS110/IS902 family
MKRTRHHPLAAEKILEAANLSAAELRLLVANYYQAQQMRKSMDMQLRHLGDKQPLEVSTFAAEAFADIEEQIAKAFNKLLTSPVAMWIKAQRGIGPVIAAGLLAHIDIEKAPTAGHIWSFAGLNPELKWQKGEKRPYNAQLKQICWHAGQCFMKQSNDPDCFYGQLYRERKKFEIARNESGGNAERAKNFKITAGATKPVKDKLAGGQLPDFNIDARARRWAVKIFLSHLHAVWFWHHYGVAPPKPFAIQHLGHVHVTRIPHAEMFPGFEVAYYGEKRLEAAE